MGEVGSAGLCGVVGWYGLRGGDRGEISVGVTFVAVVVPGGWGWVREGRGEKWGYGRLGALVSLLPLAAGGECRCRRAARRGACSGGLVLAHRFAHRQWL